MDTISKGIIFGGVVKVLIITGRSRGVCEGPRGEQTITKTFSCVILRSNRKRLGFIFKKELHHLQFQTGKRCNDGVEKRTDSA